MLGFPEPWSALEGVVLALLGGVAAAGCGLAWSGWLIVERGGPLPRITGTLVAIGGGAAAAAAAWLMVETLRGTL